MWAHRRLGPAIGIIKADDVILTQVRARLNFDDLQRLIPPIAESMLVPWRDVGGFVFFQRKITLTMGDLRLAFHHHPVLGTMLVHLQTEARAWVHHDAFDLEAFPAINQVVPPPRPMDFAMLVGDSVPTFA